MTFRIRTALTWLLIIPYVGFSQNDPVWDDTRSKNWPSEASRIEITSSADHSPQSAVFYKAPGAEKRPLIVSLHTWSGDYLQKDTLIHFCIRRGYHYIHPDFRGPNTTPEALGSALVVQDIDDAIDYALVNAHIDPENIHVIGVSGGGHATVLTYMKSKHSIRSFSAYVGIYNLIDWYYESQGRGNRYAGDIAAATSGSRERLNRAEARTRSPFFMETPIEKRQNSSLNLFCGIHDGYTGSVPVSQTLQLYNKVVRDFDQDAGSSLIPAEYITTMLKNRSLPGIGNLGQLLNRKIIYRNHYQNRVHLTVFEGGHEMPPGDVLAHVPSRSILAIGDSNGAMRGGWVDQLQQIRPQDHVINTCISGNTIGFDNLDREELNTLKNIGKYLAMAPGSLSSVVIMLGTNDCKAVFDAEFGQVAGNLEKLLVEVKKGIGNNPAIGHPEIWVVSPPPYGPDEKVGAKYVGAAPKAATLAKELKKVAEKNGARYVDTHSLLAPVFPYISKDGVHLTEEGQLLLASMLNERLEAGK